MVEIFNQVNSAGTTLSKGDLALAKLSTSWSKTREKLNEVLSYFEEKGFRFSKDWLLRCVTVYLTSQPYFSGLENVNIEDFKKSIGTVKDLIGTILDQVGSRLGLDHDQVVKGRFAFVTIIQLMKDGKIRNQYSGALESHWIPMNEAHWVIENYTKFVSERRLLLSEAANEFLDSLYKSDKAGNIEINKNIVEDSTLSDENEVILELALWMEENGLDSGEISYEITDDEGNELATFDLAWPDGIQVGLSKPITFLIEQPDEAFEVANLEGYTYFTNVVEFKSHVERSYLS